MNVESQTMSWILILITCFPETTTSYTRYDLYILEVQSHLDQQLNAMPFESARLAVRAPSLSPEESLGAPLLLAPSGNYFLELFFFFFSFQSFNNVIHPFILSFVPVVYHSIHTQSSALFAVIRTIRRHNEPSAH